MKLRRFLRTFAALACAATLAQAAPVTDQEFADVADILTRKWRQWSDTCEAPDVPAKPPAIEDEFWAKGDNYLFCLSEVSNKLMQRDKAPPLVNPEVWKVLSERQRERLQQDLKQANAQVYAALESRFRQFETQRHDLAVALQEQRRKMPDNAQANEAQVRSCARQMQSHADTQESLREEQAAFKSAKLELGMERTRLLGMRTTASPDDYNRAVQRYNDELAQLSRRAEQLSTRAQQVETLSEAVDRDCTGLKFSRKTFDTVCASSDFARFCTSVRLRSSQFDEDDD